MSVYGDTADFLTDAKSHMDLIKDVLKRKECPLTGGKLITGMTLSGLKSEDKLDAFSNWEVDVLIAVERVVRSFDNPLVTAILFLRSPGDSDTLRKQMVGRGLRALRAKKMQEIAERTERFHKLEGSTFPEPGDEGQPNCLVMETEVLEDQLVWTRFCTEERHDLEVKTYHVDDSVVPRRQRKQAQRDEAPRYYIEIQQVSADTTTATVKFAIRREGDGGRGGAGSGGAAAGAGSTQHSAECTVAVVQADDESNEAFTCTGSAKAAPWHVTGLEKGKPYKCKVTSEGVEGTFVEFVTALETEAEMGARHTALNAQVAAMNNPEQDRAKTSLIFTLPSHELNLKKGESWCITLFEQALHSSPKMLLEKNDRWTEGGGHNKHWKVSLPQSWPGEKNGTLYAKLSLKREPSSANTARFTVQEKQFTIHYKNLHVPIQAPSPIMLKLEDSSEDDSSSSNSGEDTDVSDAGLSDVGSMFDGTSVAGSPNASSTSGTGSRKKPEYRRSPRKKKRVATRKGTAVTKVSEESDTEYATETSESEVESDSDFEASPDELENTETDDGGSSGDSEPDDSGDDSGDGTTSKKKTPRRKSRTKIPDSSSKKVIKPRSKKAHHIESKHFGSTFVADGSTKDTVPPCPKCGKDFASTGQRRSHFCEGMQE
eukprot:gene26233-2927_t